jgi:hypothetical protein
LAPDVVGEPGQVVHELVLAGLVTFNPVPESKQEVVLGYTLFQFRDAYMHVGTLKTDETVKGPVVLPTGIPVQTASGCRHVNISFSSYFLLFF